MRWLRDIRLWTCKFLEPSQVSVFILNPMWQNKVKKSEYGRGQLSRKLGMKQIKDHLIHMYIYICIFLLLLQCLFSSHTLYFQALLPKVLSAISHPLAWQQFLKNGGFRCYSWPQLFYLKPFLYLAHNSFK